MKKIKLVCESGADVPAEIAASKGIHVVPMHVAIGAENLDDGSFPIQKIYDYYQETKKIPKTSATNPEEYETLFRSLRTQYPDCEILHLCYSAATTATYQNAVIASEELTGVTHIDTKLVTCGQAAVVLRTADYLAAHPDTTMQELLPLVDHWLEQAHFAFVPGNLEFLKAGGRVTNTAYLAGSLLNIKPLIQLLDGKLVSTKRYRGNMKRVSLQLFKDIISRYDFDTESLYFVYTEGLAAEIMADIEQAAYRQGFRKLHWLKAGGVITCHSGPGGFGIAGFSKE